MRTGEIVANRFEIERLAGSGGMGKIYRACDLRTGEAVALKLLLRLHSSDHRRRFEQEALTLADLDHPHVVRYLAHGTTRDGELYLAMEWLDGEDLGARLARERLTIDETITLGFGVSGALGAVHARGLVHRDLKPENLFLPGGSIDHVKLLDFGIARLERGPIMTGTGVILGTPGYLAPEQARGEHDLDARTDIFALGCVLFECLTGAPAFTGPNVMAVLAKIVFEEAPRASTLRPDVPPALDALVARMLAKNPSERPADGPAAAARLTEACRPGQPQTGGERSQRTALTRFELRLIGVVVAGGEVPAVAAVVPTLPQVELLSHQEALQRTAQQHGATLAVLADLSTAATLIGTAAATDLAAQAARCALALRALLPGRPMALAIGRGEVNARLPIGEAIDRAAGMLRAWKAEPAEGAAPILIDEVTAGLLDVRFEVTRSAPGYTLSTEREGVEEVRRLLGKPTPCLGREREIAMMEAILDECRSDSVARALLVTAGAGAGKSRLRAEFLGRVRGEVVQIWSARGDPMRVGAPFELLGQVIRQAARLRAGEPIDAQREKLAARVAQHVSAAHRARVAEFLGEMVGAPFPEQDSVQLRAARQNAMLMGDQMRRAWVDFVEAECRVQPVLLVMDDLHWGDRPTVAYLEATLRLLGDQPLMVLALARPEVVDLFPRLWEERPVQKLQLGPLPRRACEELVRYALGQGVAIETVARLVERSQRNAFILEELVRAVAEGRGDEAPGTVMAMLQSRIEHLAPDARRALRAASICGEVFWRGAVAALLDAGSAPVEALLWVLEDREWIVPRRHARFQAEQEYMFGHALGREVAYETLTGEDRALGHRLVGAWLERVGETDARVVAEHFDLGSEPGRAVGWYCRAVEQALGSNDFGVAIEQVDRALECGAASEQRGYLLRLRADAHSWRGESIDAERWALEAMDLLPKGTERWYAGAGVVAWAAVTLGHPDRLLDLAATLEASWSESAVSGPQMVATAWTAGHLLVSGCCDRAVALFDLVDRCSGRFGDEPAVSAVIAVVRAMFLNGSGDLDGSRALREMAIHGFEQAGDRRGASWVRISLGSSLNLLGAYARSAEMLRGALVDAERMGLGGVTASTRLRLGVALAHLGALDEARAAVGGAMEVCAASGYRRALGISRVYFAAILRLSGALVEAEVEARRAIDELEVAPPLLPCAHATLAQVLLSRGSLPEALRSASRAAELLESLGTIEEGESLVRLMLAEAHAASGDHDAARAAILAAHARLLACADKITDPSLRESFLGCVPENARTVELARQLS